VYLSTIALVPFPDKQIILNFMVAPCINNIKHFIVQLMHTNNKIFRLLKWLKL